MNTERNNDNRWAARLAGLTVLLLSSALGSAAATADEAVVAYAAATAPEQRAAKAALGRAISGAAEQANAALTADLRSALEDQVRSKLRLAGASRMTRG